MAARNYKHRYEVRIATRAPTDQLELAVYFQRVTEVRNWLVRLPKGEYWTYSKEEVEYKIKNSFVRMPVAVWFNEESDALAFKLAIGVTT